MTESRLHSEVAAFFRDHAGRLGLDRGSLTVEYVLNWGGFVNASFQVRDARRGYHLKLAVGAREQNALRRWKDLAPLLAPYHAPPVLDWIDLGPAAGLLFPLLPGSPPSLDAEVFQAVSAMLLRLNRDRELAAALGPPDRLTAGDAYFATLHDRLSQDLKSIRADPPGFVRPVQDRLEEEVVTLARLITGSAAFGELVTMPVHCDPWLNNLLWVSREEWYLVDWDDLRIGDPAADLAALCGPTADDLRPLKLDPGSLPGLSEAERERLPLLGRATLLDWVIDPVADWVEADAAPELAPMVREEKERVHRAALREYEQRYWS